MRFSLSPLEYICSRIIETSTSYRERVCDKTNKEYNIDQSIEYVNKSNIVIMRAYVCLCVIHIYINWTAPAACCSNTQSQDLIG